MNYQVSQILIEMIQHAKNKLITNFFFAIAVFVTYSYTGYLTVGKELNLPYFASEMIFIFAVSLILYNQVVPTIRVICDTAIEVNIFDDEMIVKTASVHFLFSINKPSLETRFVFNDTRIRSISYPLKQIFDLKDGVFKFSDRKKEVIVITTYFDKELEKKIHKIYFSEQ